MPRAAGARLAEERNERPMSACAKRGDAADVITSTGTVVIDVELCKGCELCIDACPPHVLSMSETVNERGYRFPLLTPGCIACKACSAICPDFVFSVYRYDTPVETPLPQEEQ
jgi:2-oxoglutarate ferredoxin oxidoreductase subunit delta